MKGFLDISCQEFNSKFLGNWKLWEDLAKELPEKIEMRNLRDSVDQLPSVKVEDLNEDLNLIRRAYAMFTFIAHGYVRGRLDQEVLKVIFRFERKFFDIHSVDITRKDCSNLD